MKRTTWLRRLTGLSRRTPLRKRNPERKRSRWHEQFGSIGRVMAINALSCAVPGCRGGPCENHHLVSRGAGGTWEDVIPLCGLHHLEWHRLGRATFTERYPRDYDALAERLSRELEP